MSPTTLEEVIVQMHPLGKSQILRVPSHSLISRHAIFVLFQEPSGFCPGREPGTLGFKSGLSIARFVIYIICRVGFVIFGGP